VNIIKDNQEAAQEFINGYEHDTPETKEEFEAILSTFGETSAHYALEWAAEQILYTADASGEERTKEFAANMAMTIRAVAAQAIHGETVVRSGKPFGVDDMDFE
jgi:Ser/Thr protein kinase RdoA (MazF antagonist)